MLRNLNLIARHAKLKLLLLIPLLSLSLFCFAQQVEYRNYDRFGDEYILSGAKVTYSEKVTDSLMLRDDETGEVSYQISHSGGDIETLNGKKIEKGSVDEQGVHPEVIAKSSKEFREYLVKGVSKLLEQLKDGQYSFDPYYTTVDEQGSIAYFMLTGITKTAVPFPGATIAQMNATQRIDPELKTKIDAEVMRLMLSAPKFEVMNVGGQAVPYSLLGFSVKIKGHRLRW